MAENMYYIRGLDAFTTYGIVVSSGSDDFAKPRKRKEPLSHNWLDEPGTEYDLDEPEFEDKQLSLKFTILANSEVDFNTKESDFTDLLEAAGTFPIENVQTGRVYSVFYRECTSYKRYTRIKETLDICVELTITLQEVSSIIPDGYAIYYGAAAAVPSNSAGVIALPNSQNMSRKLFIVETGTSYVNTVFSLPTSCTVGSIYDTTMGVSLAFNSTPVTVGGHPYNVYYLTQTVPNLTDHLIKVIFI